jgi:acetone carboxylase gamma subunit
MKPDHETPNRTTARDREGRTQRSSTERPAIQPQKGEAQSGSLRHGSIRGRNQRIIESVVKMSVFLTWVDVLQGNMQHQITLLLPPGKRSRRMHETPTLHTRCETPPLTSDLDDLEVIADTEGRARLGPDLTRNNDAAISRCNGAFSFGATYKNWTYKNRCCCRPLQVHALGLVPHTRPGSCFGRD